MRACAAHTASPAHAPHLHATWSALGPNTTSVTCSAAPPALTMKRDSETTMDHPRGGPAALTHTRTLCSLSIPPAHRSRGACFFQRAAVWTVVEVEHSPARRTLGACATSSTATRLSLSLSLFCGCVVVWVVLNKHRCCLLGVRRCSTPTLERVHVRTTEENVRIYADENLVTALVPSETACLASSPGSTRRMAVWTSRDESVFFLL